MTADELVALFDLEPAGKDRFIGVSPDNGWRRVFGGQVLAQALIAAGRTVEGRDPHSLHAYFLLGGNPKEPIAYEVDRVRDGRSFSTRRILARQTQGTIFVMMASFHAPETGYEHQASAPAAPPPEACSDLAAAVEIIEGPTRFRLKGMLDTTWPLEFRPTDLSRYAPGARPEASQSFWTRIGERLPDDPALHRASLLYLSDMTLLDCALRAHGLTVYDHNLQVASLDHAFWFHRPARADEWTLFAQESPSASSATGLVHGSFFDGDGTLAASVTQQGLMRRRREK